MPDGDIYGAIEKIANTQVELLVKVTALETLMCERCENRGNLITTLSERIEKQSDRLDALEQDKWKAKGWVYAASAVIALIASMILPGLQGLLFKH